MDQWRGLGREGGEASADAWLGGVECGVQELLDLSPWGEVGLLVPGGDGADGDSEVCGEGLVAQAHGGLEGAGGVAGPGLDQAAQWRPHRWEVHCSCTGCALLVHW